MAFLGVYGHVNVDHILRVRQLPGADQTVPVEGAEVRLGGTAGNVARAAASLGVPTALAACVGDDFPEALSAQLAASPIELVDLRRLPGRTPTVWILSNADGSQAAVIDQGVMGDGVARPRLDYTMMSSQWVHFSTGPPEEHLSLAREAKRLGKRVAFDPAQELAFRYPDRRFEQCLNESHLLFVNEPELKRALEKLGYGDPRQLLDHTEAVVVTRGARGATLYAGKSVSNVPAPAPRGAPPTSTVGAGDVFRGGFYAGLHSGRPLKEAVSWGCTAATLYLESSGARFPERSALEARRPQVPES